MRRILTLIAPLVLAFAGASAQDSKLEFPAASPASTLKQRVGLTDVQVVYSRPSAKDRAIFGGLVPYGKVWRTGANRSTDITFSTDVKLNGAAVPAGTYALFTIPGEQEWTVILNKTLQQPGAYKYDESTDLVRLKAQPVKLSQAVETFTIDVNDLRDESATLNLIWEKVRVPVKIETDVVGALRPKIEAAMAGQGDKKPYYQAAAFYYDHGLDMAKARQWIDTAAKQPDTNYVVYHMQAKILAKQGDKKGALEAAKKSSELALKSEGPDGNYVQMNQKLISTLR